MAGIIMFAGFAILLVIGVPIALSLGVATTAAIAWSPDITVSINTVAQRIFGGLDSTSIMAIAFFVLSGNLMTKGGISRRICPGAHQVPRSHSLSMRTYHSTTVQAARLYRSGLPKT